MNKFVIPALIIASLPAMAAAQSFNFPGSGQKNGFGSDQSSTTETSVESTQGRSGHPAQLNNNQGTAEQTTTTTITVEETGPRGVLKNDNTTNPNYDATIIAIDTTSAETDAPGRGRPR